MSELQHRDWLGRLLILSGILWQFPVNILHSCGKTLDDSAKIGDLGLSTFYRDGTVLVAPMGSALLQFRFWV